MGARVNTKPLDPSDRLLLAPGCLPLDGRALYRIGPG